jgi:membrane protein DedA with SNARE-associated domain
MEEVGGQLDLIINYLVYLVERVGYVGIFVGMFLESTFVPIPSELIMIPAGFAISYGKMNLYLAILVGVFGNLMGAIFNYFLAIYFGRSMLLKIGKYFFVGEKTIIKIEKFFNSHGAISTFIGRLIPGVRHFISLPAGLAKMNFKLFCFYTTAGSLIWTTILVLLGYFIGENKNLIKEYLHIAVIICIIFCVIITAIYIFINRRNKLNNPRN